MTKSEALEMLSNIDVTFSMHEAQEIVLGLEAGLRTHMGFHPDPTCGFAVTIGDLIRRTLLTLEGQLELAMLGLEVDGVVFDGTNKAVIADAIDPDA